MDGQDGCILFRGLNSCLRGYMLFRWLIWMFKRVVEVQGVSQYFGLLAMQNAISQLQRHLGLNFFFNMTVSDRLEFIYHYWQVCRLDGF